MREKISTWSAIIAYPAGLFVNFVYFGVPFGWMAAYYSLCMIALAAGSAGLHWVHDSTWRKFDRMGMYAVAWGTYGLLLYSFTNLGAAGAIGMSVSITVVMLQLYHKLNIVISSGIIFVADLFLFTAELGWAAGSIVLGIFGISYLFQQLGEWMEGRGQRRWADIFHTIWHIGTATGYAYILYRALTYFYQATINLHQSSLA